MLPLKILLLTHNSYLRVGLFYLIKDLVGQVPVLISDGTDLFDEQTFEVCNYYIINDKTTWEVINYHLTQKHKNNKKRHALITLSAKTEQRKQCLNYNLLHAITSGIFFDSGKRTHDIKKLTSKEGNILSSLINGKQVKAIAKDFNCSAKTIYAHKYQILTKLGFGSLNRLILFLNITKQLKNCGQLPMKKGKNHVS